MQLTNNKKRRSVQMALRMPVDLAEAMDDSAIRVSLTARLDGTIVGFLMARADFGDFAVLEDANMLRCGAERNFSALKNLIVF